MVGAVQRVCHSISFGMKLYCSVESGASIIYEGALRKAPCGQFRLWPVALILLVLHYVCVPS